MMCDFIEKFRKTYFLFWLEENTEFVKSECDGCTIDYIFKVRGYPFYFYLSADINGASARLYDAFRSRFEGNKVRTFSLIRFFRKNVWCMLSDSLNYDKGSFFMKFRAKDPFN